MQRDQRLTSLYVVTGLGVQLHARAGLHGILLAGTTSPEPPSSITDGTRVQKP